MMSFARKPQERVPHATVVFSMGGEQRVFSGHLWTQLEMLVAALDEVNRPFRLKGSTSQDVTPYPPLAFKELVVNALVHRDYELPKPVHIEITPSFICITSPGGLVEDVAEKLRRDSTEIQKQIETGGRGLKGYRNKVLADLFYGAGAMDKRGSGLADVYRWAKENNCEIRIGPIEENHFFEATLFCRPEAIDEATGTATPLVITARYMSNLIEIIEMPEHVHFAGCTLRSKRAIYAALGSEPLPPFVSHKDRLYSFADVTALDSPFIPILSSMDEGRQTVEEFCAQNDDERLVWLLHEINKTPATVGISSSPVRETKSSDRISSSSHSREMGRVTRISVRSQ
jgi:anti-sigma regulatory factor (Ser/Thr protein kinase)